MTDPNVAGLLSRLVDGQRQALGIDLVGSYLFGSAVTGEFDPGISDIDTVTVLRSDLTAAQLAALERLHLDIVEEAPQWDDRVEVVYLSSRALTTFRTESSAAARISPGEPFHAIDVDRRWLIDWYQLREAGISLCGPAAVSLVPFISHDEYVVAVRQHMLDWPDRVDGFVTQGNQAYAILTMCRGLRTWRTGEHVSKREAARWACEALPEHAQLIREAVIWREQSGNGSPIDGMATREATMRFVNGVKRLLD
jgi:aminoglycoside adenylyltransferase-like protein/nucleotidyltransferase-like protein